MKLRAQTIPVAEIERRRRDQMFALMEQYYAGMKRDSFESDLDEKQWVIELVDPATRELRGFSTQRVFAVEVDGRPIRALFSGDTIVERGCWGQSVLAQAWGELALSLIRDDRPRELFWFLISKGYKTYRYLPVFFREFYPRYEVATPDWARRILDALGSAKFPALYDAEKGIVRAEPFGCRLRRGVAEIGPERLRDPHIRFFNERNPGHPSGDELCCIAPITRENFTLAASRPLRDGHLRRALP